MGQWEWIIILVIGLSLLVAELVSVRRSIRKAREDDVSRRP
jgi:hypothetical protein